MEGRKDEFGDGGGRIGGNMVSLGEEEELRIVVVGKVMWCCNG